MSSAQLQGRGEDSSEGWERAIILVLHLAHRN